MDGIENQEYPLLQISTMALSQQSDAWIFCGIRKRRDQSPGGGIARLPMVQPSCDARDSRKTIHGKNAARRMAILGKMKN